MLFSPNTRADIYRKTAQVNNFGRPTYEPKKSVPIAVIHMSIAAQKSSVRADTSASRGQMEQMEGDAMFLLPIYVKVNEGDVFHKDHLWLEVAMVEPRRSIQGNLDHYEVVLRKVEPVG